MDRDTASRIAADYLGVDPAELNILNVRAAAASLQVQAAAVDVVAGYLTFAPGNLFGAGLTAAEVRVLALAVDGLTTDRIARELGMAAGTVSAHFRRIHRRLGVRTRAAAVREALRIASSTAGS